MIDAVKARRRDAHHGVVLSVERDVAVENAGVGAEATPPQTAAEHDHVTASSSVIFRKNGTAEGHGHIECGEEVAADGLAPDALGLSLAADAGGNKRKVRGYAALEDGAGLVAIVEVVGIREGLALREHDHAAGVPDGQDSPQQPVSNAEDRGIGGKGQGDGENHDEGKARSPEQSSNGVANIVSQVLHERQPR